jgi:hypothetical protein
LVSILDNEFEVINLMCSEYAVILKIKLRLAEQIKPLKEEILKFIDDCFSHSNIFMTLNETFKDYQVFKELYEKIWRISSIKTKKFLKNNNISAESKYTI